MGRILPASRTGCSAKNQRKLSKAIRRARALGFMPIWSRHPLVQQTHKLTMQDHEEIVRQRIFKDENINEFLDRVQPTIARWNVS
jgi:Ribosomal protein S18